MRVSGGQHSDAAFLVHSGVSDCLQWDGSTKLCPTGSSRSSQFYRNHCIRTSCTSLCKFHEFFSREPSFKGQFSRARQRHVSGLCRTMRSAIVILICDVPGLSLRAKAFSGAEHGVGYGGACSAWFVRFPNPSFACRTGGFCEKHQATCPADVQDGALVLKF